MWMMRRHDPQVQEDGFGLMRGIAAEHVGDLIAAFESETDHGLRCWLLDLMGETGAVEAADLFVAQLYGEDESFRDWAVVGLRTMDTKAARAALHQARTNGVVLPNHPPAGPS